MNQFNFQCPTRIIFGEGTASGVADLLGESNCNRPIIVSDTILLDKGVLNPILDSLSEAGIRDLPIFADVPSDSDVDCVRRAVSLAKDNACDSIIAVGGGSVIDTAKVVNIGLSLGGDLLDFEGINNLPSRLAPLIALPTTSGTGSEVSAVAMIKDHASSKKLLFGSRFLFADMAVLDPTLLISLPAKLTAATGMDAVTHALEALVSMGANPFSDAQAMRALFMLFAYLEKACKHGDDLEARGQTLLASSMAGMAFTNAGVGIVHALAHTIGARFSVHHGVANAIFLPFGMEFNIESASARYAETWSYLCNAFLRCPSAGTPLSARFVLGADDKESAYYLVKAVRDLIDQCGLPARLKEAAVPEISPSMLEELSETAMTDPAIMFNPREATQDDLKNIIKGAY